MDIIAVITGSVLLLLGRPLFWLFVGIMGFLVGFDLAGLYFAGQHQAIVLGVALFMGLVGALLALLLQRVAFGVAGFLAGGYLAALGVMTFGWGANMHLGAAHLVGGIVGAVVGILFADWALIVLSSLTGAALVAEGLRLSYQQSTLAIVAMAAVGIVVQGLLYRQVVLPRQLRRRSGRP